MNPGGRTQPYAVLGHPIAHTLSPPMHNAAFSALGMDAIYLAFDIKPKCLLRVLHSMRTMGFRGVNLTLPLKEVAFQGIGDLDDSSRLVGAVNTVLMNDNGLQGFNTDGDGFLRALQAAFNCSARGQDVVVLGSGGSARTLALVCVQGGASSVTVVARNRERSDTLVQEIREVAPNVHTLAVCEPELCVDVVRSGSLIIQATPVGMHIDDPPLFSSEAFRADQLVFDLIYTFPMTSTLRAAHKAGARTANGLDMLLYQGVRAFEIWTNRPPPIKIMRETLQKAIL